MVRGSLSQEQAEKISGFKGYKEHYAQELDQHSTVKDVQALYPVWMEGLKVWLLFAPILIIMLAVIYADFGYRSWWLAAGYIVMPFISTFVRRTSSNLFLFILTSAVMALWVLLMPEVLLVILGGGFCFLLMVYGIARKNGRGEQPLTVVYLVFVLMILTVTDLVILSKELSEYQTAVLIQGLVYTGLFLFLQHRTSIVDSLAEIDRKANRSARQMARFNSLLYLVFFVLISLLFFVLYEIRLGNLLSLLANYVLLGGRRLVRLIFSIQPTEKAMEQELVIIQRTNADLIDLLGGGLSAAFWVVTQRILVVLTIVGGILLALWLMVQLYKRFGHREVYRETDLEVSREFYSGSLGLSRRKKKTAEPEEPVRRKYYHLVKDEMGEKVHPSDTPAAVADKVPAVGEILTDYEQVRYGNYDSNSLYH